MKVFRENEGEIWLGMIPGLAALGALIVGWFVPTLDVGQAPLRDPAGLLAFAIATLALSDRGKYPRRRRWLVLALIAALPGLVRLPAGHGPEDLLRAYAGMLPHVVVGLLFLPIVRALDRRFGHYRQAVLSPFRPEESKP